MDIDTYKIKRPMGFLKHFATMWMRMWMLHSIARTMEDPSLERRLASIKCPTTMSLIDLMRCCNTVMEGDTPRRWGHIVTFMRFADRYLLTRQDWNTLYSGIANHPNTYVPALLPLVVMYLYFYAKSWFK